MEKLLVIDDEPSQLEAVVLVLERNGYDVTAAPSGMSGMRALESNHYDLVLTDLVMPDLDGMEILNHVVDRSPETKCIILTGHGTIRKSVEAIKKGAFDFIQKPAKTDDLLVTVGKALEFKELEEENSRLRKELRQKYRRGKIIGTSKPMQKIFDYIDKVADTDSTILITGPSGTGKELIARAIHYDSNRSEKPFVVINCGAIPETLLESELFGAEKGAYTGAYKSRKGRFESANGGTVFLDEIGEMSPSLQVKLLRVLEDQKFEKVGATKTIHVDVRIVAATNRNLTTAMNNSTFREDLYYRLNVIPIKVPTLRQRTGDIPVLTNHFLERFQRKSRAAKSFSAEAMSALQEFDWPGNVRELENTVEHVTVLCENEEVGFEDLPEHIQQSSVLYSRPKKTAAKGKKPSFDKAVKDFERKLIVEALERSGGVRSRAAEDLNMKRTTLVEKIKKLNLNSAASA